MQPSIIDYISAAFQYRSTFPKLPIMEEFIGTAIPIEDHTYFVEPRYGIRLHMHSRIELQTKNILNYTSLCKMLIEIPWDDLNNSIDLSSGEIITRKTIRDYAICGECPYCDHIFLYGCEDCEGTGLKMINRLHMNEDTTIDSYILHHLIAAFGWIKIFPEQKIKHRVPFLGPCGIEGIIMEKLPD